MVGGKFNLQHYLKDVCIIIHFDGEFNRHHCGQSVFSPSVTLDRPIILPRDCYLTSQFALKAR